MKPHANEVSRAHKANGPQVEGPNWLIFAAGALLSTLSIRLGYKLKQALDSKPKQNATAIQKGPYVLLGGTSFLVFVFLLTFYEDVKIYIIVKLDVFWSEWILISFLFMLQEMENPPAQRKSADYFLQTNGYNQMQDNHGCFTCISGTAGICLMRNDWKEDQHPSFINFISTFLSANSFRLNFVPIAPLRQAIGYVQAIAKASKEQILENTDLSTDKAGLVSRFLRDPKFYSRPKIN